MARKEVPIWKLLVLFGLACLSVLAFKTGAFNWIGRAIFYHAWESQKAVIEESQKK